MWLNVLSPQVLNYSIEMMKDRPGHLFLTPGLFRLTSRKPML
jgi:hypothetical protein